MASFQQIMELRKAGNLEEAYALGQKAYAQDPSVWNKRAMAWVLYDLLKKSEEERQVAKALEHLEEIVQLGLPSEETMFWEKVPWLIGKLVFSIPEGVVAYSLLERIFLLLQTTPLNKVGDGNSFLFLAFLKKGKQWGKFPDFVDWWGFTTFQPRDFQPADLPNRKRGPALVEQVLIAYAKHLLGEVDAAAHNPHDARIEAFVRILQHFGSEYPDFRYVPYYLTRLFIAQHRDLDALHAFLPFARQKSGEYWVWDLLADLFRSDAHLQFACVCKALCCRMDDKYSVKLRRRVVPLLLERGETAQAALQVHKLKAIYEREKWKIPGEVLLWALSPWAKEPNLEGVDGSFFSSHAVAAEPLIYADIPESVILVGAVNRDRRVVFYISAEGQPGSFVHQAGIAPPEVGASFRVRLSEVQGRTRALSLQQIPKEAVPETLRKSFSGMLKRLSGQAFGFVGDVFLPPDMVTANALVHGQVLSGSAVRTWDKNKSRLGWRAEKLDTLSAII